MELYFFSLTTIILCMLLMRYIFSLESIVLKSYAVKKTSAKKIVDAMLSWNKLFSNSDYKIFYVLIRFYMKNGVYNLGAG